MTVPHDDTSPPAFWPACGIASLRVNERGWLVPTDGYWRLFLARPELALLDTSCKAERALHQRLLASPTSPVNDATLAALQDPDARDSYRHFLHFRDALMQAGSLEAWYLQVLRSGRVDVPPLFMDLVVQACTSQVTQGLLQDHAQDAAAARVARAAELLFRAQRVHVQDGHVLSGDLTVLDMLRETGGLGDLGRLLTQNDVPLRPVDVAVLTDDNAHRYWPAMHRHHFVLDLTHEVSTTLSHGLKLTMARSQSGLTSLARVLEAWVLHFLGVQVSIKPEASIEDASWRWHLGLDATASVLLNDLYLGNTVEPQRMKQLLSLFRLTFQDSGDMRADVAGKPVYLALAMTTEGVVKLKPQNLLLNLPLNAQRLVAH